ncbi:MAG: SUMF1/EgtB/PvdO family nonheme iron enzyme [Planctomycetaceae bacterium]|nr:SUMF1/EgtB/PvdO family nonheme iron enzyme [Planctomycetaceae bacterium]
MSKSPTSEFQSSVGAVMIRVPAGSFIMGSPESEDGREVWEQQREVTFANDFYLGKTPVTQAQYEAVTGTNPTVHEKIGDAPVDSVDWNSANEYCQKLTKIDREAGVLPDDWEYRLPTEAEWEYACRAGSSEPRHGQPQDVAWHHDNADEKPHAVGQKTPNPWGFHDMLGNVWEWCQDWFFVANPCRSVRGGSYFNSARFCRSAQRWGWQPNSRGRYCGFRLLAAATGSFDLSPPIDDFPTQERPPSIFDAIDANDFDLALRVITADPAAIESVDGIPPPLHDCVYHDKPEWLEWLLDHGADIERREQDYGATPLTSAVVHRQKRIIPILVGRGAKTEVALKRARNGLAGAYEDFFDRKGYQEIIELLQTLGVEE